MLRRGLVLIGLALLVALLPSITPSSWWRTTRWFEKAVDARTGAFVPAPYHHRKGEPTPAELTKMLPLYGVEQGDVGEFVSILGELDPGSSSAFGRMLRTQHPDLASRLGFFEGRAIRAKVVRWLGGLIFLGGLGFLFMALYHTYMAEKDILSDSDAALRNRL